LSGFGVSIEKEEVRSFLAAGEGRDLILKSCPGGVGAVSSHICRIHAQGMWVLSLATFVAHMPRGCGCCLLPILQDTFIPGGVGVQMSSATSLISFHIPSGRVLVEWVMAIAKNRTGRGAITSVMWKVVTASQLLSVICTLL